MAAAAAPATQPAMTLTVDGAVAHPLAWSADDLRTTLAGQVSTIEYEVHGKKHSAHAVPLVAVLRSAGAGMTLKMDPKADPKTKNLPLRLAVVVRGRDGYAATFALAELLPDIGDRPVWVALDADGQPLADRSAPVELIAPADAKPGRWVRAIASISVVDPSK
jgi:DMSO/TMAO reductase YedYZ molybdopterin-dependent catalytic subunit